MSELVTRRDEEGVATLSLNRPEVLNALSPALFEALRGHVDDLADETETIGCVVLRAEGRAFSSGNDLRAITAGERAPSRHYQAETLDAIEALPQPVVAAVRGHCYTGALEVVLACDLLVASDAARFVDSHGKWGMTPTWGMSQRLPRRIGLLRTKELMFTGRAVGGEEAVGLGLANLCVPDAELDQQTAELARAITENSWHSLRAQKKLVNEGQRFTLAEGLAYERENSTGATPDTLVRLKQFGSKKA
ncbi:MAG: enoyl-CoA hydratase/isomerase family protein [Deltaproteobacteria bacterium]|nr:enoyl-CoA hydratase/isomerase family protein [Deltaproteobacteria bacterium]MBW2445796.1 enoyl-CoA hydratase/isomerase family protein [Deltaproteobacteria bacterium]